MGDFRKKPKTKAILFTDKYETTTLYKSLSWKHRAKISFGEVRAKSSRFKKDFPVSKYPTLYIIKKGESKPTKYNGPINPKSLDKFLSQSTKRSSKRKKKSRYKTEL